MSKVEPGTGAVLSRPHTGGEPQGATGMSSRPVIPCRLSGVKVGSPPVVGDARDLTVVELTDGDVPIQAPIPVIPCTSARRGDVADAQCQASRMRGEQCRTAPG